jgi:hypothetical protein
MCVLFNVCCPDDNQCDIVECPSSEPDPDCSHAELCAGLGLCCPDDGICDLARCPPEEIDADCTNFLVCERLGRCCDDERCDASEVACPTEDYDCTLCAEDDGVCIADCDPPDPDCAAANWVRLGPALVNPDNAETEFTNDFNPGDLDSLSYALSATNIGSTTRRVDNDVELWKVSFNSTFNEPPATLTPGETVTIQVTFSASGSVAPGWNPNFVFQVSGVGVEFTPSVSYIYDPYSDDFDGVSTTSYSFVVPPVRDGQISVTAFWWNCSACNVTWVYQRG